MFFSGGVNLSVYPDDPCRVAFNGSFQIARTLTGPAPPHDSKTDRKRLDKLTDRLKELQRRLYAEDRYALLLIFQGMDAAGKDGTIRAVMREVDPAGCHVWPFKQPTHEELQHDFLWRTTKRLPERGQIAIFNRSYYEELLIVRVHPHFLEAQKLTPTQDAELLWQQRFDSIRCHEQHLVQNGTLILKFFLNLSKEEQRQRFLKRLTEPEKHWKFSDKDVHERGFWEHYMQAFEQALNATSRAWAPWYAIPADDKDYMRYKVAEITTATLENLNPSYPRPGVENLERLEAARRKLENE